LPTWTEKNGQDDLEWINAQWTDNKDGTYTVSYQVKTSNHKNESGKYNTHIYVTDSDGATAFKELETVVPEAGIPEISNVKVSNLTRKGYTVTCTIRSDTKVTKVKLPTWTEKNGQDDLEW
ncbi:GBS Bsp-like repeat-containing protein, partial [[Clostridium] spiroforme]|nr:GBS Bsp-like repeat-containing protein [Thomasclavelia spiroformis]